MTGNRGGHKATGYIQRGLQSKWVEHSLQPSQFTSIYATYPGSQRGSEEDLPYTPYQHAYSHDN